MEEKGDAERNEAASGICIEMVLIADGAMSLGGRESGRRGGWQGTLWQISSDFPLFRSSQTLNLAIVISNLFANTQNTTAQAFVQK